MPLEAAFVAGSARKMRREAAAAAAPPPPRGTAARGSAKRGSSTAGTAPTAPLCLRPPCCIVLSEFSPAALTLNGSLRINPWSADKAAHTIGRALRMDAAERDARAAKDLAYTADRTAEAWAMQASAHTRRRAAALPLQPSRAALA